MPLGNDTAHKLLFSHPELVRDLLVEFGPVAHSSELDYRSMERVNGSYVCDAGTARHSDMVWRIRVKGEEWLYLYLLLEFQAEPDVWMALRMQVYVGLLLQDLQRRGELCRGKLPFVLPFVLYSGDTPWTSATDLTDLMTVAPPRLAPLQPVQRYWLIQAGRCDTASFDIQHNFAAALFRLLQGGHKSAPQVIAAIGHRLADFNDTSLRQDFARFISWLLRREYNDPTIPELIDFAEIETMLAQRRPRWSEELKQEGRAEGLAEGLAKGRLKGEASLLHLQLVHRFGSLPDWVQARLVAPTEEELLHWAKGVVHCNSLEEVFR